MGAGTIPRDLLTDCSSVDEGPGKITVYNRPSVYLFCLRGVWRCEEGPPYYEEHMAFESAGEAAMCGINLIERRIEQLKRRGMTANFMNHGVRCLKSARLGLPLCETRIDENNGNALESRARRDCSLCGLR